MMHVHPHDALADPLPFVMQDASPRPVGCSGLASVSSERPICKQQAEPAATRPIAVRSQKFGTY